jgi:transcriptional regulator with XRE-family HTH domain
MPTREAPVDRGRLRGEQKRAELGRAFRLARRSAGLSQRRVSDAVRISQAQVSRIERGVAHEGIVRLCQLATVLGLEMAVNVYPAGARIRDAGHVRLMGRLQAAVPREFEWRTEIPLPRPGDLRSIDAVVSTPRIDAGFELESKLLDAQALVRRSILKQRDAGLSVMVIVLPDSPWNRAAVEGSAATLRPSFPLESRAILRALRQGVAPESNGILFV